jgi:hypothetical protein
VNSPALSPTERDFVLRLILILVLFFTFLAIQYLPVWGLFFLAAALVLAAKFVGSRLLTWAFIAPFRMQGIILRGAEVNVHSIRHASPPSKSVPAHEDDPEPDKPRHCYLLDATITPMPDTHEVRSWQPAALYFTLPDTPLETLDETCEMVECEVLRDGEFVLDNDGLYEGPLRVRLLLEVDEDVRELEMRYFFQPVARIDVPER